MDRGVRCQSAPLFISCASKLLTKINIHNVVYVYNKEKEKKYRETHREKLREKYKRFYYRHKKELLQRRLAWRKKHPEKIKEYTKRYYEKYGDGKTRTRFWILKRDNFTCQYCGRKAPEVILEADHIIPKSKGGRYVKENLKTACRDCNIGKSDSVL